MPISPSWPDIALRLVCTIAAGLLIGFDRGEHGRPAGMRTTLLVCMAASVAMIQANMLMPTAGKPGNSFVVLDLMRLPLGILSGMGFIGAGAILRRGSGIVGVTTAATLWFTTVLGLCFGGGQIYLGLAGLAIGLVVLRGLRPLEASLKQERQGTLVVILTAAGPLAEGIRASLEAQQYRIASFAVVHSEGGDHQKFTWQVTWRGLRRDSSVPEIVHSLSVHPGVTKVSWSPRAAQTF